MSPSAAGLRLASPPDHNELMRMARALWPREGDDVLAEVASWFAGTPGRPCAAFVAERPTGGLGGFLWAGERDDADGRVTSPVAFVEGWFVDADLRGQGVGARLMAEARGWARGRGHRELGSDADLDNAASITAHHSLGFREAARIVCFVIDV